jgi:O-antigen/teichoic acid export membrane protein
MNRIKSLAKEGAWVVLGQGLSILASLVLVRILTEFLPPKGYGELALGLTVAGFVNQVLMGGLIAGTSRFYSIAAEKHDLLVYFQDTCRLMIYATFVVATICLLMIVSLIIFGYSQWVILAFVALLYSVLCAYNGVLSGIQNSSRQRGLDALHISLEAWLKILLLLTMMFWLGHSSTAVVIGYACSSLVIVLSRFFFLRNAINTQKQQTTKDYEWMSKIWVYSLPFATFGTFTWIQQASDRWALQAFVSTEDVGRYAVLFQLGYTPIMLAAGIIMNFFSPILYQRSGDATDDARNKNVYHLTWRLTKLILIFTLLGFLLTFFSHKWLFHILVASEYRNISNYLPWVILAGGIFSAGQMLSLRLMSEMKTQSLNIIKITTALIGILCNLLGAAYAGMSGIVIALVVFSGIYFIWMANFNFSKDVS